MAVTEIDSPVSMPLLCPAWLYSPLSPAPYAAQGFHGHVQIGGDVF